MIKEEVRLVWPTSVRAVRSRIEAIKQVLFAFFSTTWHQLLHFVKLCIPVLTATALFVLLVFVFSGPPGVGQFTRITKESVNKQPTRQRIIGILEQNPCLGVTDIMTATDLAEGTVRHHLEILARHGFIKSVLSGRNRYFYVKNCGLSKGQIETLALLRSNKYLIIIDMIGDVPGIDQGKIAEKLGISQCQAYVRIQQLLQKGLIRSIKSGRHVTYYRNQLEGSLSCYLPLNFNKRCD